MRQLLMLMGSNTANSSQLGVELLLDVEKIPYKRITYTEPLNIDSDDCLIIPKIEQIPQSIINKILTLKLPIIGSCTDLPKNKELYNLFSHLFGITNLERTPIHIKAKLVFKNAKLYNRIHKTLSKFKKSQEIYLPEVSFIKCNIRDTKVTAEFRVDQSYPGIIKAGKSTLFLFDIGSVIIKLFHELYDRKKSTSRKINTGYLWNFYKNAPVFLRHIVYPTYLNIQIMRAPKNTFTTASLIDITGWTLLEVLKLHIQDALGDFLPMLWRWPHGSRCAVTFTHDVEDTHFAYTKGINNFLEHLDTHNLKSTFYMIANFAAKYFSKNKLKEILKNGHEIGCHGLEHDGGFDLISSNIRAEKIHKAKTLLSKLLGKDMQHFRVPWLQRTSDLLKILDECNFKFDSSFIDVDWWTPQKYGTGISFNLPFHPIIKNEANRLKKSDMLEIPVTWPLDIPLIYCTPSLKSSYRKIAEKLIWIHEIGGLYNSLIHSGVWGDKDLEARKKLLDFFTKQISKRNDVWICNISELADWWLRKENIDVELDLESSDPLEGTIIVQNENPEKIEGITLKFDSRRQLYFSMDGKSIKIRKFNNNSYMLDLYVLRAQETVQITLKEDTNSTDS
ncbi:MAG: polysaccharide deacetylase family protein [Promethearchaeota archaeon]